MNNKIRASVIITTYNRTDCFLTRAIDSVIKQHTNYLFEIILVDDNGLNSPKQIETESVLKMYIDQGIIYLPLEINYGACLARNRGFEAAKGEYIFFLDDDDEFLPNKVQTQVDFLSNHTELDGCLAAFKRIGKNNLEIKAHSNFAIVGDFKNFVINGNFFTPMLCIRKNSLLKLGGFHPIERFQDRFMMLHALIQGLKFECIEEPLHIMYEHNGDRITNKSIVKSVDSLNVMKNFIQNYKLQFTAPDWNFFLEKDLRMRGYIFYVADNYKDRIKGLSFFLKAFRLSKQINDLKMVFKSILKVW